MALVGRSERGSSVYSGGTSPSQQGRGRDMSSGKAEGGKKRQHERRRPRRRRLGTRSSGRKIPCGRQETRAEAKSEAKKKPTTALWVSSSYPTPPRPTHARQCGRFARRNTYVTPAQKRQQGARRSRSSRCRGRGGRRRQSFKLVGDPRRCPTDWKKVVAVFACSLAVQGLKVPTCGYSTSTWAILNATPETPKTSKSGTSPSSR